MAKLLQTRRCEECGGFFTVTMSVNGGTPAVRGRRGPWECESCRDPNRAVEEKHRARGNTGFLSMRRIPSTAATGDRK